MAFKVLKLNKHFWMIWVARIARDREAAGVSGSWSRTAASRGSSSAPAPHALSASETTLQSALDAILAELAALQRSGSGGVVNAPAWAGFTTWELVRGSNVVRNLHLGASLCCAGQRRRHAEHHGRLLLHGGH